MGLKKGEGQTTALLGQEIGPEGKGRKKGEKAAQKGRRELKQDYSTTKDPVEEIEE